jgi:hypothetical protein
MKGGKNIVFLAGAGVFAVALAVAGFVLVRGLTRLGGTASELKTALAKLEEFYGKDPFPSPGNVAKENENMGQLTRLLDGVLAVAGRGQVEPGEGETPARFIGRLIEERNRMTVAATNSGVALPPNFSFGFDRYLAGGTLPENADVPRLSQQLSIASNLWGILIEEKVLGVLAIERDEFEMAASSVPRRPGAGGRLGARSGEALAQMGLMGKDALFAKLHFVLDVRTTEKALLAVMNRLARIAVVTGLTLSKEGPDILPPKVPGEEVAPGDEDAGPAAEQPAAAVTNFAAISRDERIVSGITVERPVRAVLELDVYRFKGAEPQP